MTKNVSEARERERNVFEYVFTKCGNWSLLRVSTKPLSELYITFYSLGISKSYKIKLSGYHVSEYKHWLATGISQCCERLHPVIATNNVFTIPLKYVKCRSIEIISIYSSIATQWEVLSPFQFVSFYGSSFQLAFHCLSARICLRRYIASAEVIFKQCRWFSIHRKEKARTKQGIA